jgi:hypothetical protein
MLRKLSAIFHFSRKIHPSRTQQFLCLADSKKSQPSKKRSHNTTTPPSLALLCRIFYSPSSISAVPSILNNPCDCPIRVLLVTISYENL